MRVIPIVILGAVFGRAAFAGPHSDYCTIPILKEGVPTSIKVEYIDKELCGTAIIAGQYVKLSDITARKTESAVSCNPKGICTKVVQIYSRDNRARLPYVLVIDGPKTPPLGSK